MDTLPYYQPETHSTHDTRVKEQQSTCDAHHISTRKRCCDGIPQLVCDRLAFPQPKVLGPQKKSSKTDKFVSHKL